jgi:hypothetical protein
LRDQHRIESEYIAEIMAMSFPRTPENERRISEMRIDVGSADREDYRLVYGTLRGLVKWWLRG